MMKKQYPIELNLLAFCAFLILAPVSAFADEDPLADLQFDSKPEKTTRLPLPPLPQTNITREPRNVPAPRTYSAPPLNYSFPSSETPIFPEVAALGNASLKGLALDEALKLYRPASKKSRLNTFYKNRQFTPAWDVRMAGEVIVFLNNAASEGLNPYEYHVAEIEAALSDGDSVLFDLLMTDNVLRYATHLRDGQYFPKSVDRKWLIRKGARANLVTQLEKALATGQVLTFLQGLSPNNYIYRNLRRSLGQYLEIYNRGGWVSYDSRSKLKPGIKHSDVIKLRNRLAIDHGADLYHEPADVYDAGLTEAVKGFQRRHGLNDDGIIGPNTRKALAVPVGNRIRQILAAMERLRWIPRELGYRNIVVNIPAFRLWYHENDAVVLTMRTIVGKSRSDHQTPTFNRNMTYLVLNPNWNVPQSIIDKEMAPEICEKGPGHLRPRGYRVLTHEGDELDPYFIDWCEYNKDNSFPHRLVQQRMAAGTLGSVKFMLPNRHNVYLHDTQTRRLFSRDRRAFSHGCIRLEKPMELASELFGDKTPTQVKQLIKASGSNRHINLAEKIPVYLLYLTAWADDQQVYFYDDVYRRDRLLVTSSSAVSKRS